MQNALNERAAVIEAGSTKDELIARARALGWTGDENRYALMDETGYTHTGKAALAQWLARNERPETQPEAMAQAVAQATAPQQPAYVMAQPAPVPAEAAAQLLGIVRSLAGDALNENRVRELINEALSRQEQPRPLQINIDGITRTLPPKHRHPMFEKVLRLVSAGLNVLLVGPAGTGKTTLAHDVAEALGLEFGALHCTAGASESQVLGWLLPTGDNGRFEYRPAEFARLYKKGNSLFLIDEMDAADSNFLLVLNGALANGSLSVPQNLEEPRVMRGDNARIMAAANTFGTGADMVYVGRNQLDEATRDRFYLVFIDYDRNLERAIAGRAAKPAQAWQAAPTDPQTIQADTEALADWLDTVREKATAAKLRRVISTRAYQKAATARAAGIPSEEIRADLLAGWTRDELAKVA